MRQRPQVLAFYAVSNAMQTGLPLPDVYRHAAALCGISTEHVALIAARPSLSAR